MTTCAACHNWTLQDVCPDCGSKTDSPAPRHVILPPDPPEFTAAHFDELKTLIHQRIASAMGIPREMFHE